MAADGPSASKSKEKPKAFLVFHGRFNPCVHFGHIKILNEARQRVEKAGYQVVQGILSLQSMLDASEAGDVVEDTMARRSWSEQVLVESSAEWISIDQYGVNFSTASDVIQTRLESCSDFKECIGFEICYADSSETGRSILNRIRSRRCRNLGAVVFVARSDFTFAEASDDLVFLLHFAPNNLGWDDWLDSAMPRSDQKDVAQPFEQLVGKIVATEIAQIGRYLSVRGYALADGSRRNEVGLAELPAHDANSWRGAFRLAGDGTKCPDMDKIKSLRRLVWLQTANAISAAKLEPRNRPLCLRHIELKREAKTECFTGKPKGCQTTSPKARKLQVFVVERDILEKAGELVDQNRTVAVLNMANSHCPGGGYTEGAGAQEENLHRRTDAERFLKCQRSQFYPIATDSCLISHAVTAFRGSERDGYPFLERPFKFTMLSCAAVAGARLTRDREYASKASLEQMKAKIAAIVQAAEKAGCDCGVFSAFGCGAFGNPPEIVAELFRAEIENSSLTYVVFCILNDHNAGKSHNPEGNFVPFKRVFETQK
eukprot:TRINITY_DN35920_c0_g1_i1.p1 TRINITY_DN35920_c0_g1~~TRINITY_DN35920_c0_g1_i1.p1  ORF type:complete len:560 (-),score=76.52 TRINITY_DN35920_c0_g1_i1:173-1801(-)